jgi:cytidylate kinase
MEGEMKKNLKIAISGRSGCGNTTVSKIVADTLGLRFVNFTFRALAQERNMSLKEVMELAKTDESWDKEVDSRQVKMAREEGGCVLGSRLAIWMLEEADLKVYLDASEKVRAQRILKREGGSLEEIADFTVERDKQDHARYLQLYNINNDNFNFADLIINTDSLQPQEIVDLILERVSGISP